MKIKSIIIMLSFFMTYLIMLVPFSENVGATDTTYPYAFENVAPNNQVTVVKSGFFYSARRTGAFNVSTVDKKTGSQEFRLNGGSGWYNLSYSKSLYLTNISFWFKSPAYSGGNFTMFFYNQTNQGSSIDYRSAYLWDSKPSHYMYVIDFASYGDNYFRYFNEIDSPIVINSHTASVWSKIWINNINDIGGIKYSYRNTTVTGIAVNPTAIVNNWRVDRIFLFGSSSFNPINIDDINFTISSSYTVGGGGSTPSDFSQYKILGNLPTYEISLATGNKPVIEERYEQKFTGSIYGIDIPNWNDIPSNWNIGFNVEINGMSYTPKSMYNLSISGVFDTLHIYRFDFSSTPLVLSDEKILIEFYSAITTPYGDYYTPSGVGGDVDGDGITEYKTGSYTYFNGLYDGSNTYNTREFAYLLYYEGASGEIPETKTTYNYLSVYGNNLKYNNTSPEFYRNDTVSIGWGVSDITILNKIVLRYGGANITSQMFPFTIYSPKGAIGYCPETIGNYTVRLYCGGVLTRTRYFDVIANPSTEDNNYQIHSIPPMTYDFTIYTVKYNYNNAWGYTGTIACFNKVSDVYNFSKNIYNRDINGTIYGGSFIRHPSSKEYNEYWSLFVKVGATYVPVGNYHEHFIIKSDSSCSMTVDYGQSLGNKAYVGVNLTIEGNHVYPLQDVNVYANGQKIQYVGGDTYFYFMYKPTKAMTYEFTLQVRLNNGTLYSLVEPIDVIVYTPPENNGGGKGIVPGWTIDPPFSYFIGIAVIIITTLSPLLIIGGVKKDFNLSSIPQFLYLIMAIVGFVITIIMGFFPAWSILVLVVLGGLIIAIMWLRGVGSKTGE